MAKGSQGIGANLKRGIFSSFINKMLYTDILYGLNTSNVFHIYS
jgi:hypothetical protein